MIRSELDVLLDRIEDSALRADLQSQIDRLKQRRSFGLVFEQHIPERVRLPQHPIRIGSQVVSRDDADSPTYEVLAIEDGLATVELVRGADGAYVPRGEHAVGERERLSLDSFVVITDFGEPVLPSFRYLGAVERGGDKPYHVVINGENHHALEALRFTHAGKVDCIYIDPPYNSGARDWKYNNDYVDDTDAYRHSKWLAFMERRLKLAKELLNPDDSVLIITIDEKEYLRLGLLVEQTFTDSKIQMITSVINPGGASRNIEFTRVNEYVFMVMLGNATPAKTPSDMLFTAHRASEKNRSPIWRGLLRGGSGPLRVDSPLKFFPVFVEAGTGRVVGAGDPLPLGVDHRTYVPPNGVIAVWPLKTGEVQGRWELSRQTFEERRRLGYVRAGPVKGALGQPSIYYLRNAEIERLASGELTSNGMTELGVLKIAYAEDRPRLLYAKTVWNQPSHDAGTHGSSLVKKMLGGRVFPFPKSLYAVEDTIRFFVKDKSNAVVLDFFAGSGTTAHAVMRLNRQDGGRRQSIMVTNNEVSPEEAAELRKRGLRPGDPDWEALGIFEHITRPRVTAAVTGRTPEGEPIKGDYRFSDEAPMAEGFEENAAFLGLRYLDADDVDLGLGYDDIAPLLWLRAGASGPIAARTDEASDPLPYAWTDRYGILFDEDRWRGFVSACPETATTAFIVTHSPTTFAGIAAELPTNVDTVRLPDSYLSMFLPERGRG